MISPHDVAEMPLTSQSFRLRTILPISQQRSGQFAQVVLRFLKTIWLFTFSDLKTIVGPSTAFAILSVLSGPVLTTNPNPQVSTILARTPQIAFWAWINLLPFAIDNQRQPKAIQEDGANKPWRPMPSKRLSEQGALNLMVCGYSLAIISSLYLGGLNGSLILIALGYWYNSLGGADIHWTVRNFINACGFIAFASGATDVASKTQWSSSSLSPAAKHWFLVIGAVVFSSIQTQDMYDQTGDSLRGRKTLPLVIGDRAARWTIAFSVSFWSFFCPTFWGLGVFYHAFSVLFGALIAFRTLSKVTVSEDRKTFSFWNLWMVMLYLMPLIKRLDGKDGM